MSKPKTYHLSEDKPEIGEWVTVYSIHTEAWWPYQYVRLPDGDEYWLDEMGRKLPADPNDQWERA